MAHKEGVDQGGISRDLAEVRAEWRPSSVRNFDAMLSEQLAKIERIEQRAVEGWKSSRLAARTDTTEEVNGEHPAIKARTQRRGREGSPRFPKIM